MRLRKNISRMIITGIGIHLLMIFTLASFVFILQSCSEKDVPFVIDADEIARYIREDEVGRELFTTDNLILSDPYVIPYGGDTVFIDSIVSLKRSIIVDFPGDSGYDQNGNLILADYGNLGMIREAWAEVIDDYTVKTTKIIDLDTSSFVGRRTITRKGFFLKLGNDSQAFVGWVLWGINMYVENIPFRVTFKSPSDIVPYPVDSDMYTDKPKTLTGNFLRLSEIEPTPVGGKVVITATKRDFQIPVDYIPHLSGVSNTGAFSRHMIQIDPQHFVDTVDTPSVNPATWNVLLMQNFKSNQGFYVNYLVIPYKVQQ